MINPFPDPRLESLGHRKKKTILTKQFLVPKLRLGTPLQAKLLLGERSI
jgi:hypothetical protein